MASQINPNNIDGNYPVAGQDNNSQGFRDNFTNTVLNFQFAEDEINDLQNKVLLKSALTGQSLDNNMNNNLLYAARIQAFSATKVTVDTSTNVYNLNYAAAHYQTFATTNAVSVLTFSNFPPTGQYGYYKIQVQITSTEHLLQIPEEVSLGLDGIQGISPGTPGTINTISFAQTGTYEFGFGTYDGGDTITIFDLNRALTNFAGGDLEVTSLTSLTTVSAVGDMIGGNVVTAGNVSAGGSVTTENLLATGNISASGNVSASNFSSAGDINGTIIGKLRPLAPVTSVPNSEPLRFTSGTLLAAPTAGAWEYDGKVFYASPANLQRGVVDNSFFRILFTNSTLANTATAQNIFSSPGSLNLLADTTYLLSAMILINRTAGTTAHTVALSFALGGTLIDFSYLATVSQTTSAGLTGAGTVNRFFNTDITPITVTASNATTTEFITIQLQGALRSDTAGSFTPQIQYSAAPGGAPTVLENSFVRVTPLGNSGVRFSGNWI